MTEKKIRIQTEWTKAVTMSPAQLQTLINLKLNRTTVRHRAVAKIKTVDASSATSYNLDKLSN